MRKLIMSSMISVMVLLSSCFSMGGSRAEMLNRFDDDGRADARLEQILEAIKNKDRDAIAAMFSEEALYEAENFDEGIDCLFELFPNGIDSWNQIGGHVSESNDHGVKTKSSRYRFDVYAGKEQYLFSILEYIEDTEHPERIGVYSIKYFNTEGVETKDDEPLFSAAGIYIPEK